mgnify:CR=1 FL=1
MIFAISYCGSQEAIEDNNDAITTTTTTIVIDEITTTTSVAKEPCLLYTSDAADEV